ncbi:MAG: alpha/beta fold hydrolase [Thermoflexales bacterium]|nr:alpha/beta fold hydrolase [Thermoflexales bacterium]
MPASALADQYIQIGQIRTRFWAMGDTGPAVVLVHGLGRYVEDWQPTIHVLARRHRVYALDLAGSGRSDKPPPPYSFPGLVQFVADFIQAHHIERASLVGHSLGGSLALHYAIQFPNRVEKLVLVNSAGLGKQVRPSLKLSTLPFIGERLTRPSRKGISESLKRSVHDPALVTDEWIELCYRQATLPGAHRAMLATARALVDLSGVRDDVVRPVLDNLAHITAPTLIVWGRQDPSLPVAHADVAAKRMPNAHLHVFDACRHFTQLEHPQAFNALLGEFLAGAS